MNNEALFEELESQFTQNQGCQRSNLLLANSNRIVIRTAGVEVSLVAAILGEDFVVGLCEKRASWMCFGKQRISLLRFEEVADSQLPKLRFRSTTFCDFILELKPPFFAEIKVVGEVSFVAAVTGAEQGLVFFKLPGLHEPQSAVGRDQIDWLLAIEPQDSVALEEWSNR